jgi:hypothetical protein
LRCSRLASATHCLAVSRSPARIASIRIRSSMNRIPKIIERVRRLVKVAPWHKRLNSRPDLLRGTADLRKEQASVPAVNRIAPSRQLHRKQLLYRNRLHDQSRRFINHLAFGDCNEVSFRSIVQPIFRKVQIARNPRSGLPDTRRIGLNKKRVHIFRRLARVEEQNQGGPTSNRNLCSFVSAGKICRERGKSILDIICREWHGTTLA